MQRYNPKEIEPKWQKIWEETGVYTANLTSNKPKYIAMSMFNYPSGAGIHIGHAMNYTISDVKARFKRQQGYESYHPVGWDAFGLPAENYAIKAGVSPQESMANIIPGYHKQYKAMGWSNDWEKEIATHLPEYYKWTQWIFAQMHKHGLAYQDVRMQWWCTKCQTVLANEQVIDGKCWRHDAPDDPPVEKREVKQWFFKITDYADELLEAIDALDWTESVKLAQKNWIGRKQGIDITYKITNANVDASIVTFTTHPDTNFGATFIVIAPEHPLVQQLTSKELTPKDGKDYAKAVAEYQQKALAKSEVERQEEGRKKTGAFTGLYAKNNLTGRDMPIWVSDFVLMSFGTGAVVGVPAHDERDYQFAKAFDIPIVEVVAPEFGERRDNEQWVDGATVIVYDETTDTFLGQDWGTWTGLVGGGLNDGETHEACARRELAEEEGITETVEFVRLGEPVFAHYAHPVKKINRVAGTQAFLAIVRDRQGQQTKREAHEQFTDHWYKLDDLLKRIDERRHSTKHWVEILRRAQGYIEARKAGKAYDFVSLYTDEGIMINSGKYNGLTTSETREKISEDMVKDGIAQWRTNYRMRDWSVSRQRYWGAPIPIINCPKCGPVLVPDTDLPVILPELDDFKPSGDGRSALARAKDWLKVDCPKCGGQGERETDTLDTYICSSWYMYRYFDPRNQEAIFDDQIVKKWEPVDFYNGADHATAHLLYARFIGHFFKKLGLVNEPEPFKQFLFNGKVTAADGTMFSKSKGNGIDPLEIIGQGYGADALRTYLMFAAPLELWARWDPQGVPGAYRFLNRLWNLVGEYTQAPPAEISEPRSQALRRIAHQTIKKATEDIEGNRYNTAIATVMTLVNELYRLKNQSFGKDAPWQEALEAAVACIAPFAPHIAEDLWHQLGHSTSVHRDSWPSYNKKYLASETMTIAVQINGKVRAELEVATGATEDEIAMAAKANDRVKPYLDGKEIRKTIHVPNRLISFVV